MYQTISKKIEIRIVYCLHMQQLSA